jgi:methionine S-methyltransferase
LNLNRLDTKKFLMSCEESSNRSYENLKCMLGFLEDPKTRVEARKFFFKLEEFFKNETDKEKYHFSLDFIKINSENNKVNNLILLQLPSTFHPEDWSFTFFEGLMRCSSDEFMGKSIAELGCGNGWISIALAQKYELHRVYGLDINPRAVVCAKINLYLNALTSDGEVIYNQDGFSLLDRVQFHTSDLLGYCIQNKITLDKVIGCIPQVLSPDVDFMSELVPENVSDEKLYSLSNYCAKQGVIEDQFGLGLIARALEESIHILKTNGKVIFNLGGRPGYAVLNRLFTRRGFTTQNIWQTKIEQAGDTDVLPLVEIEEKSNYRFEFFMGPYVKESISARTAYALLKSGGKIYHSLNVIRADLRDVKYMKDIFNFVKLDEYSNVRSALDLTYDNYSLSNEKVTFLSHLCKKITEFNNFPYDSVKGKLSFRNRIAEFFNHYWKANFSAESILVAPNRVELLKNFIEIFSPNISLVDFNLCKNMPQKMLQGDPTLKSKKIIIEIPRNLNSVCELIVKLRPQLVIFCFSNIDVENEYSILRLVELTEKYKCNLILDISEFFDLSIFQKSNSVIKYLSQNKMPKHVSLLCELIYNNIYEDMTNAFLINENKDIIDYLAKAAELTYSRSNTLVQDYYDTILSNLVSFYIQQGKTEYQLEDKILKKVDMKISSMAKNAFFDPAFESDNRIIDSQVIRLDYGENELNSPNFLKSLLVESFVRQNISSNEIKLEEEIYKYLRESFHIDIPLEGIVLGNGVAPLFSSIAKYGALNNYEMVFPSGAYGYFVACVKFWGGKSKILETFEKDCFKYNMKNLEALFSKNPNKKYILFLNAPIVNPMGQIYSLVEILNIVDLCRNYGHLVILDSIFFGLEFDAQLFRRNFQFQSDLLSGFTNLILLGGISKNYAAAGLRFGYFCSSIKEINDFVQHDNTILIPKNIKYVLVKLFSLINQKDQKIKEFYQLQRNVLRDRAIKLSKVLNENGWKTMDCEGGLFLVAKPEKLIGKKVYLSKNSKSVTITSDNVHDLLFKATGLLINGMKWCGLKNYCRFVISIKQIDFEEGCQKLKEFYQKLK